MRSSSIAIGVLVASGALAAGPPAHAQSFFQKLFGSDPAPAPAQRLGPPPSLRSFGRTSPYGGFGYGFMPFSWTPSPQASPTTYRTVCVRLCDGFYFPISGATTRGRFYRDAKVCQESCGSEARLFYLPRGSDDVEHMTDLSGRGYGHLPQAFLYRKELVAGCACKPEPWSEAELARHETYAMIEAEAAKEAQAVAAANNQSGSKIAANGSSADAATVTETAALPKPRPPAQSSVRTQASGVMSSSWSPAPPPEFSPFATP